MKDDEDRYLRKMAYEKSFYNPNLYKEDLTERVNPGLDYFLNAFQERVRSLVGMNVWDYLVYTVHCKGTTGSAKPVRILSLGSGPGGTEMNLARRFSVAYEMTCLDINEESLNLGRRRAKDQGLNLKFITQDVNKLDCPPASYDIVFAHASLHHMLNHEHIAEEVKRTLYEDGVYIVYDVITRNGMRMWDDTRAIVAKIWSLIPTKYKYDLSRPEGPLYLEAMPDIDLSENGFECIRSEDLYGVLKNSFTTKIEVQGFSFARRFFDHPFGWNYDVALNPFDRAVAEAILRLDEEHTAVSGLRPESIFLVLEK
jgi:SAM-dependent methyltransferase